MRQLSRFVTVGILNTLWGYLVIFGFMYLLGCSPEVSNIAGYAIGLATSYLMHRNYTFRSHGSAAAEFLRFLGTFAIAFSANLVMLSLLVRLVSVHAAIAQIISGATYVATSYLLNRRYVFRHRPR